MRNHKNKKLLAIFLSTSLALFSGNSFAQQFVQTYGGSAYDSANSIITEPDGKFIFVGSTESFGAGASDLWVVKVGENGNILSETALGGSMYDRARAIQPTSDGGYFVAGYTGSFGNGGKDFWLLKFDSSGNLVENVTLGGSADDVAEIIKSTSDGGYLVVGYTRSFGEGGADIWVVKLDSNRNILWQKTYGGEGGERASSVIEVSDGYIISGHTGSFNSNKGALWVIKLDFNGNITWQKAYDGDNRDKFGIIKELSDGNFVLVGYTKSFGAGEGDIWILKIDSMGNVLWSKTYGGVANDMASDVLPTSDGGFIIIGQTESFGTGGVDAWALKLDSNGNIMWEKTYGGTANDVVKSIKETVDGGFVLAGRSESYGTGGSDAWILKLDSNGNMIGGCAVIGTSAAIVNDVSALFNIIDTTATAQNTTAIFNIQNPSIINTSSTVTSVCYTMTGMVIDPTLIQFGSIYVSNDSDDETINVYNYTGIPVLIKNVVLRGQDAVDFRLLSENCTGVLPAGTSCNITVDFKPQNVGLLKAVVKVIWFDGISNQFLYTKLRGTGRDPQEPDISADTNPRIFNATYESCSVETITIINSGGNNPVGLIIDNIILKGRDAADFSILSENCITAGPIAAGGSCTIDVQFCPFGDPTVTVRKAVIKVRNNDCDENPYKIKLRGYVVY